MNPLRSRGDRASMSLPLVNRRTMVAGLAMGIASPLFAAPPQPLRAIAFDAFPIFDPRSIATLARERLGEKGDALAVAWSAKLFGYGWLETAAGRYTPFATLADAALRHSAEAIGIALDDATRLALVAQYGRLDLWPDVKPALAKLRAAGLRLVFLSNLGEATLRANIERGGIGHLFDAVLSTDRVRAFKPAPRAYHMAMEALHLPRGAIGFAAFGGWDAVGATWFGYPTAWVNRAGAPAEPLGAAPAVTGRGMESVLALAGLR